MISYDPTAVPQMDQAAYAEARRLGLQPFHVICDEPGAKVGELSGVAFSAFGAFLPRVGDRIKLQDGTLCQVTRVYFKVFKPPGSPLTEMLANVVAIRISAEQDRSKPFYRYFNTPPM